MRGPGVHVAPPQCAVQPFEHAHHVRVTIHRTSRQAGLRVHGSRPGRHHQLGVNLRGGEGFLRHPAAGQFGQPADRGQHPLTARRRVQGGRLAQQRQERPHRVVPPGHSGAHRRAAFPQPGGRFRRWWQVLGSNQRRLSRRFYRPSLLPTQPSQFTTPPPSKPKNREPALRAMTSAHPMRQRSRLLVVPRRAGPHSGGRGTTASGQESVSANQVRAILTLTVGASAGGSGAGRGRGLVCICVCRLMPHRPGPARWRDRLCPRVRGRVRAAPGRVSGNVLQPRPILPMSSGS